MTKKNILSEVNARFRNVAKLLESEVEPIDQEDEEVVDTAEVEDEAEVTEDVDLLDDVPPLVALGAKKIVAKNAGASIMRSMGESAKSVPAGYGIPLMEDFRKLTKQRPFVEEKKDLALAEQFAVLAIIGEMVDASISQLVMMEHADFAEMCNKLMPVMESEQLVSQVVEGLLADSQTAHVLRESLNRNGFRNSVGNYVGLLGEMYCDMCGKKAKNKKMKKMKESDDDGLSLRDFLGVQEGQEIPDEVLIDIAQGVYEDVSETRAQQAHTLLRLRGYELVNE